VKLKFEKKKNENKGNEYEKAEIPKENKKNL